jgi:hypothetical protein
VDAARSPLGVDLRVFVAATTAAAGVVHLSLAPGRFDDHAALGLAFGAIGLAQLGAAGLGAAEPVGLDDADADGATGRAGPARWRARRGLWPALALGTTVLVGLWLAGHLIGVPFGPRAGEPESVHPADAAVLAFEVLTVVGSAIIHVRPEVVRAARRGRATRPTSFGAVGLVAVCVASVLAAPGALDAPGERDPERGSSTGVPPPSTRGPKVEGLEDMPGATLAVPGTPTTFPAPGTPGPGTGGSATPSPSAPTAPADNGFAALFGGRREVPDEPLDRATRAALASQLAATADLVTAYPTIAAAESAGYRRAGPFTPGSGTPYAPPRPPGNTDGRMDPGDVAAAVLLFDGTAPTARLAGFLYLSNRAQTDGAPEGFAGPNDRWTFITNVCTVPRTEPRLVDTPLGIVRSASAGACAEAGGTLLVGAYYALHVWTVPGYDSGGSTFRDVNASIVCADGGYRTKPLTELGSTGTLCRS